MIDKKDLRRALHDYEIEGLAIIRYVEPRFVSVPNSKIIHLYSWWSNVESAAGWLSITNGSIERFCKWAFTTPYDFVMGLDDNKFNK